MPVAQVPRDLGADEVAAGHIDHAVRFILPNARIRGGDVYVHPGTHTTSATKGGADAPPYGVHFRLKSGFDLSTLPSDGARTVAKALQKYGMFLAYGGNIALTAAADKFTTAKWGDASVNVDAQALASIKVTDFEVVKELDTGEQYGMGVRKGNTALLNVVNEVLADTKSSGEYDKIYEKWFGKKPPTK